MTKFKPLGDEIFEMGPKKFILEHLIPFIVRDQGNGFAMNTWIVKVKKSQTIMMEGIMRTGPSCGTIGCIGGSVEILYGKYLPITDHAKALGLTLPQTAGLYSRWRPVGYGHRKSWPRDIASAYSAAGTRQAAAEVACDFLKQIAQHGKKSF